VASSSDGAGESVVDGGEAPAAGATAAAGRPPSLWRPPTLGVLLRLDDVAVAALLERLVLWLADPPPADAARARELDAGTAAWLFALMARIETPVVTGTLASVSDLARYCSRRAGSPEAQALLCVCRGFFGQG